MSTARMWMCAVGLLALIAVGTAIAALVVPTDIELPGTQPQEVGNLESPDKCDNCHGGYDTAVEPAFNWRGSMMANAGRDPIFWATLAIAEQDFDGAGDLCIRCHSTAGWLAGRSTPTDGSGLASGDADGVECDYCHKLTNPDNSEHVGEMNAPFIANSGGSSPEGYYGSGMSSVWGGKEKLGPYAVTDARHQFMQSQFHRSRDYCGTCHDVSNSAVGDLAHNNGAQFPLPAGSFSGVPGAAVEGKAAFKNFPFQYGIVERTFSEHKSSLVPYTLVSAYTSLPEELRDGAFAAARESAIVAGTGGNYADGAPRYFTCQTCHMRAVTGQGCDQNPPVRADLPLHDMTGGNYWMPEAIQYLDTQNKLRLGGGLTATQIAAMNEGRIRAFKQLSSAVSLEVDGDEVYVVNLTGHKLLSGYPEGRRMWLNIKWYDDQGVLLREDGKYGPMTVSIGGQSVQVDTLLDLHDVNTKVYEAHYGMTQQWATQLLALGYSQDMILSYDRVTGAGDYTLGQLAAQQAGTSHETFHFVLNNTIVKDNRIPPYGMNYAEAARRNCLPVPADQYGVRLAGQADYLTLKRNMGQIVEPGEYGDLDGDGVVGPGDLKILTNAMANGGAIGSTYQHWDEIHLNPPPGAVLAAIDMLYQPTSWEYIQFLYLANNGQNAFLADEGVNLLEAWLNTGMAEPYVMTSATWSAGGQALAQAAAVAAGGDPMIVDSLSAWGFGKRHELMPMTEFKRGRSVTIVARVTDASGAPLVGSQVFMEVRDPSGERVTSLQGFSDEQGEAILKWRIRKIRKKTGAGVYKAVVRTVLKTGYAVDASQGVQSLDITVQ